MIMVGDSETAKTDMQIRETRPCHIIRLFIKSVFLFVPCWALVLAAFSAALGDIYVACVFVALVILVSHFYKRIRVARIKLIREESVVIQDGKKEIELTRHDILHVTKMVRYTFTETFGLVIATRGGNFWTRTRYMVINDSHNNLTDLFTKMEVRLKNVDKTTDVL